MLVFHEIKKLLNSSVLRLTAAALLFACLLLSYYAVKSDETEVLSAEQLQNDYDRQMALYIESAERGLSHLDGIGSKDDYAHEYYETVIKLYTEASAGKIIRHGSAVGWDSLLNSDVVLLLSIAAAIVAGGITVFEEKRTGSIFLIFASKKGRLKTGVAKAAASVLFSVFFCAILTLLFTAVFFASGRLSSGLAELQTAESFRFSPYNLTLAEGLMRITAGRILISALSGALSAIFSELFGSYVLIFAAGVIPAAGEYLIYKTTFTAVDIFAKNVNVFSFGGAYLLQRYYSVRLFGCTGAVEAGLLFSLILIAAASGVFVLLYSRRKKQFRAPAKKKKTKKAKRKPSAGIPGTLFGWEFQKNLAAPYVIAVLAACTVTWCAVSADTYGDRGNTEEAIYRGYCEKLEKMTFEDALKVISEEKERISRASELYDEAQSRHSRGEISNEEYSAMMEEYGYRRAHEIAIKKVSERAAELSRIEPPENHEIRFVYDKTLNSLLDGDFSFLLVILLTVGLAAVFSREYESGLFRIIRTCKNGRMKIFRAKLLFAAAYTAVFFILFFAFDAAVSAANGAFVCAGASVLSLSPAKNVPWDISIGTYFIIMYAVRFAAYEIFALILASLSEITGKTMTAALFASAVVFVPYVVGRLGSIPGFIDLSALLSANRVLLTAEKSAVYFFTYPLVALFLAASAVAVFTSGSRSERIQR